MSWRDRLALALLTPLCVFSDEALRACSHIERDIQDAEALKQFPTQADVEAALTVAHQCGCVDHWEKSPPCSHRCAEHWLLNVPLSNMPVRAWRAREALQKKGLWK